MASKNPRGRTASGKPNPVDVHVGARMRLRRNLLGMSQGTLGEALGLTFQQVQKYERGMNRVGASRLFDLSRVLDVPVSFFFDDMPDEIADRSPRLISGAGETSEGSVGNDPLTRRETLELVRAYYRIASPETRKQLRALIAAVADSSQGSGVPESVAAE